MPATAATVAAVAARIVPIKPSAQVTIHVARRVDGLADRTAIRPGPPHLGLCLAPPSPAARDHSAVCLHDHEGDEGEGGVSGLPHDLPAALAGESDPAGLEPDVAVA